MITVRTPLRISFVGGGTDLPSFYTQSCGRVVSTTINKYVYTTVKEHDKIFNEKIRLNYLETELVDHVYDIKNNIIRTALEYLKINKHLYISTISDFPSKSGLGSSSSFAVGLLQALHALRNERVSLPRLAQEACKLEIELLKNPIGKQDQYAAAIGGLNAFTFMTNKKVSIQPIVLKKEKLAYLFDNLMLFWTGLGRDANSVLKEQNKNIKKTFKFLQEMSYNASKFKRILSNGFKTEEIGEALDENWELKKRLASKISNSFIDKQYKLAMDNGALGGKICGAGNGGCLLLVVKKENQDKIRTVLTDLRETDIKYEPEGSRIL